MKAEASGGHGNTGHDPGKQAEKMEPRVCVVTGLSGAGKSTALRVFEDLGFFTVDGLPASLTEEVLKMASHPSMEHFRGIALGMDIRQNNFPHDFEAAISAMKKRNIEPWILFLEANHAAQMRRYAMTRRPHPLEKEGNALETAIITERTRLSALRDRADLVLDTSEFSIHDLRRAIQKIWNSSSGQPNRINVNILSFGFKFGIPQDADMVFDFRFLPNPFFLESLRPLSGRDKLVEDYIFSFPQADEFFSRLYEFIAYVLEKMENEGRYRVTIACGCTGGRHRSVAFAEKLSETLTRAGYMVSCEHRHISLPQTS